MIRYRIRQKGKENWIVEQIGEDGIKSKTLNPSKLWELLSVSDNVSQNVSKFTVSDSSKIPQRFEQALLTEPQDIEESKTLAKKMKEEIARLGVFKWT